ncbi:complex I subunit 4 family protein [Shewanella surugensis]|uniref:NADH-quinone oxidoreductase subunit M n=1 Tax=Shewanella surugensis TaxID=212020 RepID=A0ABT0L8X8_9GAMM|nr:NADH-quinone oxidoreductase subunit M [Shewanella surugensis]MCL1124085.1 NADH-quinone oxidoreductase subunit M [Shewanella surugensis]
MLNTIIFTPFIAAIVIAIFAHQKNGIARIASLSICTLTFFFILGIAFSLSDIISTVTVSRPWIQSLGITYQLALDGFSLVMILVSTFIAMMSVLVAWQSIHRWDIFGPLLLMTLSGLLGVFLARDMILFYVFWEVMLIPLYFMLTQWGSQQSHHAATRFLLYTITASLFMLIGIICLYIQVGRDTGVYSFAFTHLLAAPLSDNSLWIFLALFIGFAVKVPLFPLHLWAPDTYKEAHPAVTILLSGAMANAGVYGILRICTFVSPLSLTTLSNTIMGLAATGAIYTGLIAYQQNNLRSVAAYSSISHMNLAIMAIFAMQLQAINGSMLQLVAHALSITGIFAIIAMLAARGFDGELDEMGGLFKPMPKLGAMLLFFFIASAGLPGLGNFASEILILVGSYQTSPLWAAFAAISIVIGIAYFLRCYERAMLGPIITSSIEPDNKTHTHLSDLHWREMTLLSLLVIAILWLGISPDTFLQPLHNAVTHIIEYNVNALRGH